MSYLQQTDKMGRWKIRKTEKKARGRSEKGGLGRQYIAIPPAEGWPAFTGDYAKLGLRGRKG